LNTINKSYPNIGVQFNNRWDNQKMIQIGLVGCGAWGYNYLKRSFFTCLLKPGRKPGRTEPAINSGHPGAAGNKAADGTLF
jgi:hypothetical protein